MYKAYNKEFILKKAIGDFKTVVICSCLHSLRMSRPTKNLWQVISVQSNDCSYRMVKPYLHMVRCIIDLNGKPIFGAAYLHIAVLIILFS